MLILHVKFSGFNRKDFRPAYSKLGSLASMFPNTPLLGLTATATKATQKKIDESLGLINATEIVTKNCCMTWNIRVYANFVLNLLAYLISAVSP